MAVCTNCKKDIECPCNLSKGMCAKCRRIREIEDKDKRIIIPKELTNANNDSN